MKKENKPIQRPFATGLHSLLLLTLFFLDTAEAEASFRQRGPDARIEAMGGAGVALEIPAFGICYNPASGGASEGGAAVSYSIPFGDASLKTLHAAISENNLPFDRKGGASLSYRRYGSDAYRETSVYAGYSTTIAGRLRAGIAAGILDRDSGNGGSSSALGLDIGLLAGISDSFTLGASVRNLNRPKIGDSRETVPAAVFAGAAYRPADDVLLTVAVENGERSDTRIRSGGEVRVLRFLRLRAGFSTHPRIITGGAGFTYRTVEGDVAVVRHPDLGTGAWYTARIPF